MESAYFNIWIILLSNICQTIKCLVKLAFTRDLKVSTGTYAEWKSMPSDDDANQNRLKETF